ncbi:MAG: DUF433 domain-containing protein [Chthoniobacterales bacterium]
MPNWRELFVHDPAVCHGQLCVKGTRVLVVNILDSLAEGSSEEEILRSYPSVRREHLRAALTYAAELAHEESLLPVSGM